MAANSSPEQGLWNDKMARAVADGAHPDLVAVLGSAEAREYEASCKINKAWARTNIRFNLTALGMHKVPKLYETPIGKQISQFVVASCFDEQDRVQDIVKVAVMTEQRGDQEPALCLVKQFIMSGYTFNFRSGAFAYSSPSVAVYNRLTNQLTTIEGTFGPFVNHEGDDATVVGWNPSRFRVAGNGKWSEADIAAAESLSGVLGQVNMIADAQVLLNSPQFR